MVVMVLWWWEEEETFGWPYLENALHNTALKNPECARISTRNGAIGRHLNRIRIGDTLIWDLKSFYNFYVYITFVLIYPYLWWLLKTKFLKPQDVIIFIHISAADYSICFTYIWSDLFYQLSILPPHFKLTVIQNVVPQESHPPHIESTELLQNKCSTLLTCF